jgi:hypothetical protein
MLEPRYSRLSSPATNSITRQALATGNGFGGSNLTNERILKEVISVVISSTSISDRSTLIERQSSPLIIEVGKIILLACWFWCAIGANFCLNITGAIVDFCTPDI